MRPRPVARKGSTLGIASSEQENAAPPPMIEPRNLNRHFKRIGGGGHPRPVRGELRASDVPAVSA
jgi:hypothetical protein